MSSSTDEIDQFLQQVFPEDVLKRETPLVTLTYAQSLDAKIAGKHGEQLILSGKESMAMTHRLRLRHNAILVGVGTLLNDNPQLNCRIPSLEALEKQPYPYILDTVARTPINCKLIENAKKGIGHYPTIVVGQGPRIDTSALERIEDLEGVGCKILEIPMDKQTGKLNIQAFISQLSPDTRLMVEGGAQVISAFLQSGAVDRLIVTVAPTFVGASGISAIPAESTETPPVLQHIVSKEFGIDTVVASKLSKKE